MEFGFMYGSSGKSNARPPDSLQKAISRFMKVLENQLMRILTRLRGKWIGVFR
jgi:hypothetical protein